MKHDLHIQDNITIPDHELEITASKAGGHGGQHVNKTDTKITVRWNVKNTHVLSEELKERVLRNLHSKITHDGDFIVHNSESRSQHINKEHALKHMAQEVRKALYVPKKRVATKTPKAAKESRLREKTHKSSIKKMRSKKIEDE